jgi:DNA invertase Pin-like site-specific DNA recombinase
MTMRERQKKIRDLREQGVTTREIARSLMVTVRTVYRILGGGYD